MYLSLLVSSVLCCLCLHTVMLPSMVWIILLMLDYSLLIGLIQLLCCLLPNLILHGPVSMTEHQTKRKVTDYLVFTHLPDFAVIYSRHLKPFPCLLEAMFTCITTCWRTRFTIKFLFDPFFSLYNFRML